MRAYSAYYRQCIWRLAKFVNDVRNKLKNANHTSGYNVRKLDTCMQENMCTKTGVHKYWNMCDEHTAQKISDQACPIGTK